MEAATEAHLRRLKETLTQDSAIIRQALAAGHLHLVVSKYLLSNGQVEVLDCTW